jgi:hypothetical protein
VTSPLEHLDDGSGSQQSGPPADLAATAVSIACPGCRRLVPVGTPCRSCGRPATPAAVTRDLTVVLDPAPDATLVMEPVPPAPSMTTPPPFAPAGPPPVSPGQWQAPAGQWQAAPEPPIPGMPAAVAPLPAPAPQAWPRRRRTAGLLAGGVAIVLVTVAAIAGLRSSSGGHDSTAPVRSAGPTAAVAVPATAVRAAASSTQRPDGSISYAPANTLDGRPATAWNSDGQGAGATLTYTFARPVDLTSITVLNGYQKVLRTSGGKTVDLFALNQRVKALRVVTDAGSVAWTLRDDRGAQTLARAFGRTRTVRLEVQSTYPSRKYKDLAVSEVRFTAKS